MSSRTLPLHNDGIYRNLPTFPASLPSRTAIITGANGISGFHTLRVLLRSPQRWSKVYALSRRPPPPEMLALLPAEQRARVQHVALDLLEAPDQLAQKMREAGLRGVDAVFFYAYLQPRPAEGKGNWNNAEELVNVNSALLRNFLEALPLASLAPSRILLQTGAKNYGLHLGRHRTPATESDPRVTLEPNFYHQQEDLLFAYCRANAGVGWNIICPAWVIGAVSAAAMNALHPLAVYAAVRAQRGEPLAFPGDLNAWLGVCEHSSAMLTGFLSEWAVLEEGTRDQKFNASDSSPLPMNRLWPALASWFGAEAVQRPELDPQKITVQASGSEPTPLGYGPPSQSGFSFTLTSWASDPANATAWRSLMAQHGLTHDPFADVGAHFPFGDAAAWGLPVALSMNKARYFGWTGFVDTMQSLHAAYAEMNRLGMLPPMVVKDAEPLV